MPPFLFLVLIKSFAIVPKLSHDEFMTIVIFHKISTDPYASIIFLNFLSMLCANLLL